MLAQERKLDKLIYKVEKEKAGVIKTDSDFDSQQTLYEGKTCTCDMLNLTI